MEQNTQTPATLDVKNFGKPPIVNAPAITHTDEALMFGLSTEQKDAINKMVAIATRKTIPNYGGTVNVLIVFEHTFTVRKTDSESSNEFILNKVQIELPRYEGEGENRKPLIENMKDTGRKDGNGNPIYTVKTKEVVKGWKQLRTISQIIEQKATVYYPYVIAVSEKDAKDFSAVLGYALTEHEEQMKLKNEERKNSVRKSGYYHCFMGLNGESVGTKAVSTIGVEARLLFTDYSSFCKGIYNRLKRAIDAKTNKVKTVNVLAKF